MLMRVFVFMVVLLRIVKRSCLRVRLVLRCFLRLCFGFCLLVKCFLLIRFVSFCVSLLSKVSF